MIARIWVVILFATACTDPLPLRVRARVSSWLVEWESVRQCMLAAPEYGPDGTTAFTVSSLQKETWCFEETSKLLYDVSDEDRRTFPDWEPLADALRELQREEQRGAAIDKIDAIAARIRAQLRLPKVERFRKAPIVLARGRRIGKARGDVPTRYQVAYPSGAWAAYVEGNLRIVEAGRTHIDIKLPKAYSPLRAMDAGNSRVVFLQPFDNSGFAIARSDDKGRTWTVERSPEALEFKQSNQDPVSGVVDIVVHSEAQAFLYRFDRIEPWTFPKPVEIPRFDEFFRCRDANVLWAADDAEPRALYRVAIPGSRKFILDIEAYPLGIRACRGTSALVVEERRETKIAVCRAETCTVVRVNQTNRNGVATLLSDGRWIYASSLNGIVGIWLEGKEPTFYRLQSGHLVAIREVDGVVSLEVRVDEDLHEVVPVPAT